MPLLANAGYRKVILVHLNLVNCITAPENCALGETDGINRRGVIHSIGKEFALFLSKQGIFIVCPKQVGDMIQFKAFNAKDGVSAYILWQADMMVTTLMIEHVRCKTERAITSLLERRMITSPSLVHMP